MAIDESELEKHLRESHAEIKFHTYQNLIRKQPFRYMQNLSHYAEQSYNVPAHKSFEFGLNQALDYYNKSKKDFASKFYSLKHGADSIIRYCWYNYGDYNK